MKETKALEPPRAVKKKKKKSASPWFLIQLLMIFVLMGGIAYSAWFAPWARPIKSVTVTAEGERESR